MKVPGLPLADRYLDPATLAARLGVGRTAILAAYKAGRIPGVRLSRKVVRFDPAAVAAALARHEVEPHDVA